MNTALLLLLGLAFVGGMAWLGLREHRRKSWSSNGKAFAYDPPRVVTVVVVYYGAAEINGVAGHRFAVHRWIDDQKLGGGWIPGDLSRAHAECAALCVQKAWAQPHQLRRLKAPGRSKAVSKMTDSRDVSVKK